ncbi:hypothetical protein AB0J83_21115 [Actinoplanes sp. NPDC049596]|uniref:hypothetical protein n=1 Tax=unclassified Actinoplanes TaxID=2626549 RepID=UPI003435AA24
MRRSAGDSRPRPHRATPGWSPPEPRPHGPWRRCSGRFVATGLQRDFTPEQKAYLAAAEAAGAFAYKTTQQGAATTLVAAVAPEFARTGGHYLDDGNEAYTVPDGAKLLDHSHAVKRWALDPETAEKLWVVSLEHLAG